jgi:Protein of unknown function (DUF1566)
MNRTRYRMITLAMFVAVLALGRIAGSADARSRDRGSSDANQRFVVLAAYQNEAVLDTGTGLIWQRSPSLEDWGWVNASQNCRFLDLGGQSRWRLPSTRELASLIDPDGTLPSGHPFVNIAEQGYYWSGSIHESGSQVYAKKLAETGFVTRPTTDRSHALCVRGPDARRPGV